MLTIYKVKTESQLSSCLKIRKAVFVEEKGVDEKIEIDFLDTVGGDCAHFLACENDSFVGTFRCVPKEKDCVKIERFCVLKEVRHEGFGREMMKFACEYYKNEGVKRLILNAKLGAAPFYERCGFEKIGEEFEEAGVPHVKMFKCL